MTSFLDYYKIILDKVSFDPVLFRKEYHKARRNLGSDEIQNLNGWVQSRGFEMNSNAQTTAAVASTGRRHKVDSQGTY